MRLLDEKCRQTEDQYRQQRAQIVARETARRNKECDTREEELREQRRNLLERWERIRQGLEDGSRPTRLDEAALEEARRSWQLLCERDQEQLALARQWLAGHGL